LRRIVHGLILACAISIHLNDRAEAMNCTASIDSPVTFSGLDILSGSAVDASSTLQVTCTVSTLDGVVGALLNITVCPNLGAGDGGATSGTRHLVRSGGSEKLNYNIFQDASRTVPWGHESDTSLGTVPPMTMSITVPLLGTASNTISRQIYFRLFGSQQTAPPGSYVSNFSGSANSHIKAGIGLLGCPGLYIITSSPTAPFSVQANITKNCTVITQSVDFGSVGLLAANVDANGQVRVTCTLSTGYSVGLSVGSFTPTTRRMLKGSEFITYGLYQDSGRSQGWGDTAGTMPTGTGSGLTQNYTVYGRVQPQATPSAGNYSDTLTVTITY
jgi:spore coat protein U-like protein